MTNKKQIQTKKISFILALSVIIYAAIDTYLFLCHDINIMRITTPVILGLVVILLCAIMLCMVRMSVPAAACNVANVLRYEWNVMFLVIPAERIHSFIGICVQLRISPLNTKPFFSAL